MPIALSFVYFLKARDIIDDDEHIKNKRKPLMTYGKKRSGFRETEKCEKYVRNPKSVFSRVGNKKSTKSFRKTFDYSSPTPEPSKTINEL